MGSLVQPATAGNLKDGQERATASKYFDWKYAQHVWFDLNTTPLLDAEYAKYSADFEPWLALYKQSPRKAFDELDKMPKDKRARIRRGYDVQLAWDEWFDHVYSPWYNGYPHEASVSKVHHTKTTTFDDELAVYGKRAACIPNVMLDECGPVPDWRSKRMLGESAAMMQKAEAEATAYYNEWAAKYGPKKK